MTNQEAVERIAFLIWDGPLHDALTADRRYHWDAVLATARNILAAYSQRDDLLLRALERIAQPQGACANARGPCRGGQEASEIALEAVRAYSAAYPQRDEGVR